MITDEPLAFFDKFITVIIVIDSTCPRIKNIIYLYCYCLSLNTEQYFK